jgi:hypothetical protein
MVPCDHRGSIGDLVALINSRVDGYDIVELKVRDHFVMICSRKFAPSLMGCVWQVAGATISGSDMIGDVLVDGDKVSACTASGAAATAGEPEAEDGEIDMGSLMAEISSKIAKADETLRKKAEVEKRGKMEAEALLQVFRAVSRDSELAIPAITSACLKLLDAEYVNFYFICEIPGQKKQLRLAMSGKSGYKEGDADQSIYSGPQSIDLGAGIVGISALDKVAEAGDRDTSVFKQDGNVIVVCGPEALQQDPAGTWAADTSVSQCSRDVTSMISSAVRFVPESKSMVTYKTDEELKKVT